MIDFSKYSLNPDVEVDKREDNSDGVDKEILELSGIQDLEKRVDSRPRLSNGWVATGIKNIDKEIEDNDGLSLMGAYVLRKYASIDPGTLLPNANNVNMSIATNGKTMSATDSHKQLRQSTEELRYIDDFIQNAEDGAGTFKGIDRKLSNLTGGIWGLNDAQSKYAASRKKAIDAIATRNGRMTNQQENRALAALSGDYADAQQTISSFGKGYEQKLEEIRAALIDLNSKGYDAYNNPQYREFLSIYADGKRKANYLKNTPAKDFDKNAYNGYIEAKKSKRKSNLVEIK